MQQTEDQLTADYADLRGSNQGQELKGTLIKQNPENLFIHRNEGDNTKHGTNRRP